MKKLYYIRTNGYDCIISEDAESQTLRMYNGVSVTKRYIENGLKYMSIYLDGEEFVLDCENDCESGYEKILAKIEDDSSWEEIDWCDVNEVFDDSDNVPDGSRILAEIEWED